MQCISSIALFLILSTFFTMRALSSPTSDTSIPAPTASTTFTIPRLRQPNAVRNGPREKLRAFRKRGWPLLDSSVPIQQPNFLAAGHRRVKQPAAADHLAALGSHPDASSTPNDPAAAAAAAVASPALPRVLAASNSVTGSVFATPEPYHAEYLSPVSVGTPPQPLLLDFDTGSSDFWVFSSLQPGNETVGHAVFNVSASSSWRLTAGASWSVHYGDGTQAGGAVGTERVSLGGIGVSGQGVEVAEGVSETFVDDGGDGIVGLGFDVINSVRPNHVRTFFDNIRATLLAQVFTASLAEDGSGSYDFGFLNHARYNPASLHRIPVDPSFGFWQLNSTVLGINGTLYANSAPSPAIADTGTSLLILDPWVADGYWSFVDGAGYSDDYGGYVFECKVAARLPSFQLVLGNWGVRGQQTYVVNVPGPMLNYAQLDEVYCYGGLQSNEGYGLQIFGDMMFRNAFFVFYGTPGKEALGVADKT